MNKTSAKLNLQVILSMIVLLITTSAYSSESDSLKSKTRNPKSVGFYYQYGNVVLSHAFVKGENPNKEAYGSYHSISAKYGIHTQGGELWQQVYANPVFGAGIYKCFFTNDYDELGNPLAIYSFIDLPLKRWNKWSINWEIEFGVAFNWNQHETRENNYYYPIGTYSTLFVDFGLTTTVQLGKHFDLTAAIAYTHFSNGAIKLPNLGINMFGARLELQYIFKKRPEFQQYEIPKYKKEWEYIALIAPSMRQVAFEYIDDNGDTLAKAFDYGIVSFSTSFNRQISHKVKFGAGFDISYNTAYGAQMKLVDGIPEKAPYDPADKILVGVFPSFELVLGKMALIAQPGFYIYQQDVSGFETPTTYQRIGVKYHFWDHLVLGLNLRAFNFSKADFIEWFVGYRIKWQKSYR